MGDDIKPEHLSLVERIVQALQARELLLVPGTMDDRRVVFVGRMLPDGQSMAILAVLADEAVFSQWVIKNNLGQVAERTLVELLETNSDPKDMN